MLILLDLKHNVLNEEFAWFGFKIQVSSGKSEDCKKRYNCSLLNEVLGCKKLSLAVSLDFYCSKKLRYLGTSVVFLDDE